MTDISAITIGPGSEVTLFFTLSLPDGTVADCTDENEPITFTMGDGSLIEGLEMMLYGLKAGDKQCLSIEPIDAFGYPDEESIHIMPREEFDESFKLEEGLIIEFETPSGEGIPGTIKEISDKEVTVDFNHPCAGFVVTFDVEIVKITPSKAHLEAIANGDFIQAEVINDSGESVIDEPEMAETELSDSNSRDKH